MSQALVHSQTALASHSFTLKHYLTFTVGYIKTAEAERPREKIIINFF